MKLKLHLAITDPLKFAKGDYAYCFDIDVQPTHVSSWIDLGMFEIEIEPDQAAIHERILSALEKQRKKEIESHAHKLALLDRTRQEFLALAAPIDAELPFGPLAGSNIEGNGTG